MEKPKLLRDSSARESGLCLSVVSIDGLQIICRDTDNNDVMCNCWWTNHAKEPMRDLLFSSTSMAAMTSRGNHLLDWVAFLY